MDKEEMIEFIEAKSRDYDKLERGIFKAGAEYVLKLQSTQSEAVRFYEWTQSLEAYPVYSGEDLYEEWTKQGKP